MCSVYQVSKVRRLPIRKIRRTFGLSITRPCDLLPLILKLVRIIAHGVGKLPTNFDVSQTFCSRLIC